MPLPSPSQPVCSPKNSRTRWLTARRMTPVAPASAGRASGGVGQLEHDFRRLPGALRASPNPLGPPRHSNCLSTLNEPFPIRRRMSLLVLSISVGLILCGYWRLPSMAAETSPEFAPPFVEIPTEAHGLSVDGVGPLISDPMDQLRLTGGTWLDDSKPDLPGIETDAAAYGLATFIDSETDEFKKLLFGGAIVAVLPMALFLFDRRMAIINLLGIPLAFLAALVVLRLRGSPLRSMVFAGLVVTFGAVMIGAIIDFKSMKKRLHVRHDVGVNVFFTSVLVEPSLRGPAQHRIRTGDLDSWRHPRLLPSRCFRVALQINRHLVRVGLSGFNGCRPHADPGLSRILVGKSKVDSCPLKLPFRLKAAFAGCFDVRPSVVCGSPRYWTLTARGGFLR